MSKMPFHKYRPFAPVSLPDRQWPGRVITRAPVWCSVDLRDGNQALVDPMGPDRKRQMFVELVKMGFKEIEVGFPSASQPDFDFVRQLIEEELVPADVTIQVLTQAREHLIRRTFQAIRGARRAIVHLYNSTSPIQRRVVFGLGRDEIRDIALRGTALCKELADGLAGTEVLFEYSPESFTGTELDFALEVCEGVLDLWKATPTRRVILNLPATVELATPNVYADQIEWFGRHLSRREAVVLSLHPHNDRGTGVAAAELGLMAGADRVEGTLFGNGERTGNVDVVNLALNLLTQGIDPELDIPDIDGLVRVAEHCNRLPVHPRHPYAGTLVFSAFSGSHQDAIRKGLAARRKSEQVEWEVPYLPIDPSDLGRTYEAVIRINSQSGKGGVGYVMETDHGYRLPRDLLVEFSQKVQERAERSGEEVSPSSILALFQAEYLDRAFRADGFQLAERAVSVTPDEARFTAVLSRGGNELSISGSGASAAQDFVAALRDAAELDVVLTHDSAHALAGPAGAHVAYVELTAGVSTPSFAVAVAGSPLLATLKAVARALNRLLEQSPEALGRAGRVEGQLARAG